MHLKRICVPVEYLTIRADVRRHDECLADGVYLCLAIWPLNAVDKVISLPKGCITQNRSAIQSKTWIAERDQRKKNTIKIVKILLKNLFKF